METLCCAALELRASRGRASRAFDPFAFNQGGVGRTHETALVGLYKNGQLFNGPFTDDPVILLQAAVGTASWIEIKGSDHNILRYSASHELQGLRNIRPVGNNHFDIVILSPTGDERCNRLAGRAVGENQRGQAYEFHVLS